MKRALLVSLLALCSVLCGAQLWSIEGLDGVVASLAFDDTSEFAPGFSDSAFRAIRSGMTAREVTDRLGAPLHRSGDVWFYSRSACDSHFHLRLVRFDHAVVTGTHAEFYVD
ncbi:MAG: hypothetical protein GQE15_30625 [Archangiaceae bacterium]|nr:hypothetical protein [Archangiaceae bacterium]